ncbi:hypothetical protein GDO81_004670 [Engystomops pustulosus]|uniref:Uncharacterized protein n=1 Tax=Engystomops pustulosus TaxID=76066 RepID=A0AAV7CHN6_ENGPU|nr:hypothetical protein GDO81_004670 [Engystomops pustulosus]
MVISWAKASDMSSRGSPTAMHDTILSTASSSRSPLYLDSGGSFSRKSENTYSVAMCAMAMSAGERVTGAARQSHPAHPALPHYWPLV